MARKIVEADRSLGISRFDLKYDTLGTSVADRTQTIELLGTAVKPLLAQQRSAGVVRT